MYCTKCGCKIDLRNKKCPDCGADIKDIEYSGGFWGLVGEETKKVEQTPIIIPKDGPKAEKHQVEQKEEKKVINETKFATPQEGMNAKEKKSSSMLYIGVIVILLLVSLIQTVRVSSVTRKVHVYRMKYQKLKEDYQNLGMEFDMLKGQYDCLMQELEPLDEDGNECVNEDEVNKGEQ